MLFDPHSFKFIIFNFFRARNKTHLKQLAGFIQTAGSSFQVIIIILSCLIIFLQTHKYINQ